MFFEIPDFVEIKIMTLNGIELETSDLEINLKQIDEKVILHFEFAHVNAFLNWNLFVSQNFHITTYLFRRKRERKTTEIDQLLLNLASLVDSSKGVVFLSFRNFISDLIKFWQCIYTRKSFFKGYLN